MRAIWTGAILALLGVPTVLVAVAAWYMLSMPGRPHRGGLPPATVEVLDLASRLRTHVGTIARAPRNLQHDAALEEAARYIERSLQGLGYGVQPQDFAVDGSSVRNIEATRDARINDGSAGTLVIGAHYDSYENSPGANDNATGTAAVLELARLLKDWRPVSTRVRFVLFVNEEPPYYRTPNMGSWRYAKMLSERSERVRGMISLETLGAYSDMPGSQRYPAPFNLVFPATADFVAFVGLPGSRGFLHDVIGPFRKHLAFPTIGGVAPDIVPGVGWSDHWAFHRFGFPAIMVTDTALFRYPHYHLPSDTPEKVDYDRLARIVNGLEQVIREIAR